MVDPVFTSFTRVELAALRWWSSVRHHRDEHSLSDELLELEAATAEMIDEKLKLSIREEKDRKGTG